MPKFPLSPSRWAGNLLFVSGQVGQENGTLVSENTAEQVAQAVANVKEILAQNGMGLDSVVDATVFLVNQEDYLPFNEIYVKHFEEPCPTRTTVTVTSLPLGSSVEIKVIALRKQP